MKSWQPDDWRLVSTWYDKALMLEPERREAWVANLEAEDAARRPLVAALTRLLAATGEAQASGFLNHLPRIERVDTGAEFHAHQVIGPYRLVELLGRGGMAEVWLAVRADGEWQRDVALKLPYLTRHSPGQRSAWLRRFERERDILAGLRHANIATLLDAGVSEDGIAWLALEYVRGLPITAHCDEQGLGLEARLRLFRQVLMAIQHAHAHLVIHRDLKPANVLVTEQGEVRLLDFGIAKLLAEDENETQPTELTLVAGRPLTPAYASPEQVLGRPLTTASDIYSLGVMFYELVCGQLPYELHHDSGVELERAILDDDPRLPSRREIDGSAAASRGTTVKALRDALAPELDAIALRALEKSAEARYHSVDAMCADIDRWLAGEPVLARPPSRWLMVRKFAARHRFGVATAATALAALLAVTSVAVLQRQHAQQAAARAVAARDLLFEMFRLADPDQSRGANLTARELLDAGRKRAMEGLENQPLLQAELLAAIGDAQRETGQGEGAGESLAQAAALFREQGEQRQLVLVEVLAAQNAERMIDFANAERWLRRAEADATALGSDPEIQSRLAMRRGASLVNAGQFDEAERQFRLSAATATQHWGADSEQTLIALARLADVQGRARRYEDAMATLDDVDRRVARNDKLGGGVLADLDIMRVHPALDAGRYGLARAQAATAGERCRANLGDAGSLCRSLQRLQLMAALRLGRVDEAQKLAVDLLPELDGAASHARKLRLASHVARALAAGNDGRYLPAVRERLQEGWLADGAQVPGSLKRLAGLALAEVELRAGRPRQARRFAEEVLQAASGEEADADLNARAQMLVGVALQREQRHAEALAALALAIPLHERAFGHQHVDMLLCALNRVASLLALGRAAEALKQIDDSLPGLRKGLGADAPVVKRVELWRADLAAARPVASQAASANDMFL